jgi:hypothetical protein
MAIGPFTTGRSGSDSSWMGSRHAVAEAHPGTLDATAFATATGVENGVVPSGYPVALDGDLLVPYNPDPTTGNTLYGFSIDDRDISNGDEPTAVMWHGRIKVANLPVTFTAPADAGAFVFEGSGA